jgi:hypothetical protein
MNTNFTPAPWDIESDSCAYDTRTTVVGGGKIGGLILPRELIIQVGGYADWKTAEANATLIAAAPEMYEMLVYYVGQYGCKCGHPACSRCKDTIETEAILKKARGE